MTNILLQSQQGGGGMMMLLMMRRKRKEKISVQLLSLNQFSLRIKMVKQALLSKCRIVLQVIVSQPLV